MHERDLDMNLIGVFDALIRERSVTRAAEQLGVTQSAMSHALARLRAFYDDPLFVKSVDGMQPTPRAEALAPSILKVMETVRSELLSRASFNPLTAERRFSLCMTDMGELVFLPPLIAQLRKAAPRCTLRTLQLPLQQIPQALEAGDADLALGSMQTMPQGLYRQQLFTHPFVTLVAKRNRKVGTALTLAQFQAMPHVVVTLTGKRNEAYDRVLDDMGIRRNIYLITPHFLVVPLILEQNPDMVATVPRELGTVFSRYNAVRVVAPPLSLPRFALRQHWHPRFHHDEANVWLRQLIKKTFASYPE
ncbi:LysR family transcriptional regulator [Cupriavidus basilensis]|uniref:LysR family transcriptional regulator n=1 Tax=Cupriavidus basilensis TaxID=68895 RepID=A0ABT6AWG2_9BURK|nr:LysR family transcriptional regulator [Cupriavidus basilensis]MDF3836036.1 LysR family transcriptional regulator [Cupriavidus basilensis]